MLQINPSVLSPSIAVEFVPIDLFQLWRQSTTMFSRSRALINFVLIALVLAEVCFVARALQATQASPANVEIPKTPAGEQFSAWLAAFNSGQRDQLEKFRSH